MTQATTITVNKAIIALFKRYKIKTQINDKYDLNTLKTETILVQNGCKIEPYSWYRRGNNFCSMGAFSYNMSPLSALLNIGRYVSIAKGLFVMEGRYNHPYSRITSSDITFTIHPHYEIIFDELSEPGCQKADTIPLSENAPITIGHDVWIGMNVTLKPGITIGTGAIIGANAMVTHNIPPYTIWGGIPARFIKMRFEDKVIERLLESKWWEYAYPQFGGLNILDPMEFCDGLEELKAKGLKKFEPEPLTFEEIIKCYMESVAAVSPVTPAVTGKPVAAANTPGPEWTGENLLPLYAGLILSKCKYRLPFPVLRPAYIKFPLSKDHAIHYEILFYGTGVKLAVHFEGKWRRRASCMSELLKQKLPLKLTENHASTLDEFYCFIEGREKYEIVADTACVLIEATLPRLKVRLQQLTKDNYLNGTYTLKPDCITLQQVKESNASLQHQAKLDTRFKNLNASLKTYRKIRKLFRHPYLYFRDMFIKKKSR